MPPLFPLTCRIAYTTINMQGNPHKYSGFKLRIEARWSEISRKTWGVRFWGDLGGRFRDQHSRDIVTSTRSLTLLLHSSRSAVNTFTPKLHLDIIFYLYSAPSTDLFLPATANAAEDASHVTDFFYFNDLVALCHVSCLFLYQCATLGYMLLWPS